MRKFPLFLAGFIIAGFIVTSYFLYIRLGYVSAPGGDLYNHVLLLENLKEQGFGVFFQGYPRLFHFFVLVGTELSGKNPLQVMLVLVPIVVSAAALLAFLVLKRLQGAWVGIFALVLSLLVARQPLQTLYDGGFPNFISVAIWLPLGVLGLAYLEQKEKRTGAILLSLSGLLMLMTHHFSALYFVIFILCACLFVVRHFWKWSLFAAVIVMLLFFSPLGASARHFLELVVIFDGNFPWAHIVGTLDNPNALVPWQSYSDYFTPVIWWGGCATMFGVVVATFWRKQVPLTVKVLTLFTAVLLLLSQVEALRFPVRVGRDAGVFLVLLTAYGAGTIGKALVKNKILFGVYVVFLVLLTAPYIWLRLERMSNFEMTMQYTPALDTLSALTNGEPSIAIDQYLPSVAHPNVGPLIAGGVVTNGLRQALEESEYVILVESNNDAQIVYEKALFEAGFILSERAEDPVHVALLYKKSKRSDL